jgi:hypothetical protein
LATRQLTVAPGAVFDTVAGMSSAVGDSPLPYMPWVGGEFRWRLGMRPLDLADWIQIGSDYDAQMTAKAAARAEHLDTVFVSVPEALPACAEVLEILVDHLTERWPDDFVRTARDVVNVRTGERLPLDGSVHPLDVAGRLVQEDLIVMVPSGDEQELIFGAGSVCLPNRWNLQSKLGRTMTEVHAPVSRLNEQLGVPIGQFFERLQPDRSFWRLGWGVIDSADLFQPLENAARTELAPVAPGPDDMHVRVERETLRRLPRTNAILFTIRTYIVKAGDLIERSPDDASRLAEAIGAMPDDVRAYKQVDVFEPALQRLFAAD